MINILERVLLTACECGIRDIFNLYKENLAEMNGVKLEVMHGTILQRYHRPDCDTFRSSYKRWINTSYLMWLLYKH